MTEIAATSKSESAFRTISEVAEELGVQQHVLRFWETKFSQVKPLKRGGGRRYYRPEDVALLKKIHTLLYAEGYTIKGVQKLLKGVSKTQVLAEQQTQKKITVSEQASKAFGAGLPKVEGPELPPQVAAAPASPVVPPEYVEVLNAVLEELMEMRSQVQTLMAERDERAA